LTEVVPFRGLFDLKGRSALVTGAGSGLGRVFSQALAAYGAAVTCADIEFDWAEETAAIIRESGGDASALQVDVSDESSVAEMAGALTSSVDILVNNAGIAAGLGRVHELASDAWRHVLAVNLDGVFYCTKAVLPQMVERRRGSIINISSVFGLYGVAPDILARAHYAASKAGVAGFTKQLAVEYAQDRIRANAIAPGWHGGTRLGSDARAAGRRDIDARITDLTPMKRYGKPEELAGLVLYLASDASSFVTGQIIAHDGGWTAW
jgi:NAD(P)-dependent dehydrogenase (short-subunit alcohol dehydrogenase family)